MSKRGAPYGNTNNLKHGYYARNLHHLDLSGPENHDFHGLQDEINLIRAQIRRVVQLADQEQNFEQALNLLRILCLSTTTLTRLVKTQKLLSLDQDDFLKTINLAIDSVLQDIKTSAAYPPPLDGNIEPN